MTYVQFTLMGCTYPGFEGDQFKDHLHREQSSEEHVEDVHCIVKIFGLPMMLQKPTNEPLTSCKSCSFTGVVLEAPASVYTGEHSCDSPA